MLWLALTVSYELLVLPWLCNDGPRGNLKPWQEIVHWLGYLLTGMQFLCGTML